MSSSSWKRLPNFATKPPKPLPPPPRPDTPHPQERPQNIQRLVKRFKINSKYKNFRNSEDPFEGTVRRFAVGKHFSAIESILEYQKKFKGSMGEEPFVIKLISLYGKAGMFDHACKLFDELPQYGCPTSVPVFNALLYACVKCDRMDKLRDYFRELAPELGIELNVFSYNTVIRGLCASGDCDTAMKMMEEMEEKGIDPDIVSYNTLLEGYFKLNNLGEAERLLRRMEMKGVIPDVRTYNARLHSLIRNDQLQEAFEFVENMVNGEVKPDTYSYRIVIYQCIRNEKLEEAKILHSKMVGVDCLPDEKMFQMLISFACDKCDDVDYAFELAKQSFELEIFVYRELMQLVVDALIERSMIDEANKLVEFVYSSSHRYKIFV